MARPTKENLADLSQRHDLTEARIEAIKCPDGSLQAFLRDKTQTALRVRVTPSGVKSFVFERKLERKTVRIVIGRAGTTDWTVEAARVEAGRLSRLIDMGINPLEQERQQRADKKEQEVVAAATKAEQAARDEVAKRFTLRALLNDYVQHLRESGRLAHGNAQSIFNLHIFEPWPSVADAPATALTTEQLADMMRRVVELGHGRTANKLRAYVSAAFGVARSARFNASVPLRFKSYCVRENPADPIQREARHERSDKNPLTLNELRAYWRAIKDDLSMEGAALRLHLLTGGQRIEQLVRLKTCDVYDESIVIFDLKGRRSEPRAHPVPLLPLAKSSLALCATGGEFALSCNLGKTPLAGTTLSNWSRRAASGLEGFSLKRIRASVSTHLGAAGVSREVSGRLQSHGIGGVQSKHYDAADYLPQTRKALEVLLDLIDSPQVDNVLPFTRAG